MTWVKVDDLFPDHPKLLALERDRLAAMGVWLIGTCYSARHLTDGYVPAGVLPKGSKRLAEALVEVGLWTEEPGGYRIHDYDEYQPTKQYIVEQRAKNVTRQRRWRNGVSNGSVTPAPYPTRTDPVPRSSSTPLPPKPGVHMGQHSDCAVCEAMPARESA